MSVSGNFFHPSGINLNCSSRLLLAEDTVLFVATGSDEHPAFAMQSGDEHPSAHALMDENETWEATNGRIQWGRSFTISFHSSIALYIHVKTFQQTRNPEVQTDI